MRMSAGIVESGRGVAIGRGGPLGVTVPGSRNAFGIVGVLSTERTLGTALGIGNAALGSGGRLGIGSRLAVGSTSGSGTIAGSSSGDVTAGNVGTDRGAGKTGAAASGARGEAVHATDAISARPTKSRIPTSPRPANEQVFSQPTATKCKQAPSAVHSASVGLTGLEASP